MASSSWEKWPDHVRDKWHDDLRDIDFWFNGYRKTETYTKLRRELMRHMRRILVCWNVGVGPMASFTQAISGILLKHYTYGCDDGSTSAFLEWHVRDTIVPRVIKHLVSQRYLLVAENLQWPIEPDSLTLEDVGLPPARWENSRWVISTISHDAYKENKSEDHGVISIPSDGHVGVLIPFAMHQSAEHIHSAMRQKSKQHWHYIALQCFHYAMAMFAGHSQVVAVTSDELIHHWATQGILPSMVAIKEEEQEEETTTISSKCSNMHRVGRVILEAFKKYSLLQLPFSPANDAYEATSTGAQFLAYHGLIAEGIAVDELFDEKKKWISFASDHGWHVSREWFRPEETRGTTALILRGCSDQSPILSKLDSFLPNLCFLLVLDLSYTPLKSLPSSIGRLQNLWLLSLRGCHDLETLSSSSTTSATDSSTNTSPYSPLSTLYQLEILDMNGVPFSNLTQDVANQKSNLIYLDMSYSEITTFPLTFFEDMSNLEELILTSCSNLVELPPSMASLSSLTTLEVIGTQIKYFPWKIFEEMQKLQSLKLIDNKELMSLTRPISRVQQIKLEGHPSLISFVLIGAPHIRRLSLRESRKLESVEIKNLGALEELDLSGTAIKDLPADIPNNPQLRRLLLVGVPSLRRFPWHKLERLPDVFYLDHCSEGNGNHSNQVTQVGVSDPRFFHSFRGTTVNLVRAGRFLLSFYVQVAPCITNSMRLQDEEGMLDSKLQEFVKNQSTYVDVYGSFYAEEIAMVSPVTVPLRRSERHMEITGMQSTLDGLRYLLSVTKSISVTCASSIDYFSWEINFQELEECELRRCHKMTDVFYGSKGLKNLRNVHVCNLKSLDSFCSQDYHYTFSSLELLHLEDCPRLEHVVPHTTTLPCLKTLDILFGYKLKSIFISNNREQNTYQLPSLQRIRLQELPLLQHFYSKDATITTPVWKELHIRGCWSLRRLPLLEGLQPETVKVNGERSWWSKLQWGSPLHRDSYDNKLPPKFASFDHRAKMSSYLR